MCRKRVRRESYQSSDTNSSQDATSRNHKKGSLPRKQRKFQQVAPFRRPSFRSPSPFHDWDHDRGVGEGHLSLSQSSEKADDSSQIPESVEPDSSSEVDWESFIREDSVVLPSSNWEAEFLLHQAQALDRTSYKGLLYGALSLPLKDDGADEEEPWHPYDPESIVPERIYELYDIPNEDQIERDGLICYGAVCNFLLQLLRNPLTRFKDAQKRS